MPPPPSAAAMVSGEPAQSILDAIDDLVSRLLLSSINLRSFSGRWQLLRSKLASLQELIASLPSMDNPLLQTLLSGLLSTLRRLKSLSERCADASFNGGKLRMQSDLDMSASSLSDHLRDLDLLLRSGVLHRQSAAVVVSRPGHGQSSDAKLLVRDIFARLQIGGIELKKAAMDSLLQLLSDGGKFVSLIAGEGKILYLVQLLDLHNSPSICEQAVTAVSILASENGEARKCVLEGGGLGPLLKLLDTSSIPIKEKAAIAVESITTDAENILAVSALDGISVLIEACKSGSPAIQSYSAGAIMNVARVDHTRASLAEEGAVPVLIQLLSSMAAAAQAKAAAALSILADSGGYFRALILQERGLQKLMRLMNNTAPISDVLSNVLRAIISLSIDDSVIQIVSSSTSFVVKIGELIEQGNADLQYQSASLLANLFVSDGDKRAISSCMPELLKLMECPKPVGLQDSAAQALVSLLSVRSNRKELAKDEKSMMRLAKMLDPGNDAVPKKLPVAVSEAILTSGSHGCRQKLLAAGADRHLRELAKMDVPGAKTAARKLAGSRIKGIFGGSWKE